VIHSHGPEPAFDVVQSSGRETFELDGHQRVVVVPVRVVVREVFEGDALKRLSSTSLSTFPKIEAKFVSKLLS
jgi:hypothetical protein